MPFVLRNNELKDRLSTLIGAGASAIRSFAAKLCADKVVTVEDIIAVTPCPRNYLFSFLFAACLYRHSHLQFLGYTDFVLVFHL